MLEDAQRRLGRREKKILRELIGRSVLDADAMLSQMSDFYKIPSVDLHNTERDATALRLVPFEVAKRHGIFPIKLTESKLVVAISDPTDLLAMDDLRALCGLKLERMLSNDAGIQYAIDKHYRLDEHLDRAVKEMAVLHKPDEDCSSVELEDINSPISKTVQHILENAAQLKASDIHFEPQEESVELRYRIDGDLRTIQSFPAKHCASLVARIKILSEMDIAEQRKPQDGRARLLFRGRKVDLRVSTLPTLHGEKVVIRLLNQESAAAESLEALGLDPEQREAYLKAIGSKQGIVLVTGPTGSGKTTTLYASLNKIKCGKRNITTIEDPVEYLLPGVNQTQINPKIGVTFPAMLRSILRQDPDVILVGEVRDRETADIAFRASLTGHLVFSTLHTNSALGAVTRLFDLGLEPYLVGSALLCVVAQRLARVICPDCREAYEPDPALVEPFRSYFGENFPPMVYRGRGCVKCAQTGFRGRTAIFEVLPITDELRSGIAARMNEDVLLKKAKRTGFRSMAESAVAKVLEGVIPLEEALAMMPAYEKAEADLMMQLADFIDAHQKQRLVIVKNDELIRKILLHTAPQDYTLIEANPEPSPAEPTFMPEMPALAPPTPERRRSVRIARDIAIKFRNPDVTSAEVEWEVAVAKNISNEGCNFRTDRQYKEGEEIDLHVHVASTRENVPVLAKVRHCSKAISGDGLHLVGVSFDKKVPQDQ